MTRRLPSPLAAAATVACAALVAFTPLRSDAEPPMAFHAQGPEQDSAQGIPTLPDDSPPFGVGERYVYDVKFGPIKAGTGVIEVLGIDTVRGQRAYHTRFRVKGGTFFYKVNDVFESWFDVESLASLRFVQDFDHTGNKGDRNRRYEIFPERAEYVEEGKEAKPSVRDPLDDGSFFYFIRTIPLEVGETYTFNRYFRPERNPVTIRVVRKERISVPAGKFETIVIQPIIKGNKVFSDDGRAEVWLTDDRSRIVVQMKTQLNFGSLNLYLKSARPPNIPIE